MSNLYKRIQIMSEDTCHLTELETKIQNEIIEEKNSTVKSLPHLF